MTNWLYIVLGVLAFFLFGGAAGCYPTHSDVKDFQRIEMDYVKGLVDAHDKNMTEQHKTQTPEKSTEVDVLAKAYNDLVADVRAQALKKVEEEQPNSAIPGLEDLLAGGIGGLLGAFGIGKFGTSRAQPALDKVTTNVASLASVINQVVAAVNGLKPGSVAPPPVVS